MELKDLEYFIGIVNQGSFTKASKNLNVTQPTLSQALKRLENEFGCRLLQRDTRRFNLTSEGEALYNRGQHVVEDFYALENSMKSRKSDDRILLRIGMSPFYSKYYVPVLLPILNEYRNIRYVIVEDISMNLEKKLLDGSIDLCFIPRFPQNMAFEYRTICIEEILLAIPETYEVNRKAISGMKDLDYINLSDVKNLPFVSLRKEQRIRPLIDEACRAAGFTPNIVYETLDWDTVNIMITNGIGVGFVPDILMSKVKTEKKHPCFYRITNRTLRREYSVAWMKNHTLPPETEEITTKFRNELMKMH